MWRSREKPLEAVFHRTPSASHGFNPNWWRIWGPPLRAESSSQWQAASQRGFQFYGCKKMNSANNLRVCENRAFPSWAPDKDTINPHLNLSLTISWAEEPAKTCWIPGVWKPWDDKRVLFQAVTCMGMCYMAVENEDTSHGLMFGWAEEIPFTLQTGQFWYPLEQGPPTPQPWTATGPWPVRNQAAGWAKHHLHLQPLPITSVTTWAPPPGTSAAPTDSVSWWVV